MVGPVIGAQFDAAWQDTWPAAEYRQLGGFRVGRGMGGGLRVSAARATAHWDAADIAAVEAAHAAWGQPALFAVEDGDSALSDELAHRAYQRMSPTLVLSAPAGRLADRTIPPITALDAWPPLAIQSDLWTEQGFGPARQAVMHRACHPKTAILGRTQDRAAGVAFVAASGAVAMVHAMAVLPQWRREGLGGWMIRRAAEWAQDQGARTLALTVAEANASARAFLVGLGFEPIGQYAYWQRG